MSLGSKFIIKCALIGALCICQSNAMDNNRDRVERISNHIQDFGINNPEDLNANREMLKEIVPGATDIEIDAAWDQFMIKSRPKKEMTPKEKKLFEDYKALKEGTNQLFPGNFPTELRDKIIVTEGELYKTISCPTVEQLAAARKNSDLLQFFMPTNNPDITISFNTPYQGPYTFMGSFSGRNGSPTLCYYKSVNGNHTISNDPIGKKCHVKDDTFLNNKHPNIETLGLNYVMHPDDKFHYSDNPEDIIFICED